MLLHQQPPIVVDVVKQPPVAPEITMGDVVLGAIGLTGVIILCALVVGLLVGAVFIAIKRRREADESVTDAGSSTLRL
jgi:hypothetical protein